MFQTNVFGTTDCIRAAVPIMKSQDRRDGYRGQIMIVSSAAARRGLPFFGAYSATKFAQLGIVRGVARRVETDAHRRHERASGGHGDGIFRCGRARSRA